MTHFISEVSSNHSRSLDRCIKFIDKSAAIGCDSVKFQLFKIDKLFSKFTEIKIALPGIFVIYLFFSFLYESPLDLMIIIDNAFIMLLLLIVFAFSGKEISKARS